VWVRRLRLWSGLVIASFVLLHLVNHALGLLSLDVMDGFRRQNARLWQSPPGTVALYGSLLVHAALALWSVYRRRTLRMPAWEASQLALGLSVPVLLAGHVGGTRLAQVLMDFDVDYPYVLAVLWGNDWWRWRQALLVLVVWGHAVVGLHFWLRLRSAYRPMLPVLYPLAVLVPVLALLGYARAGLEVSELVLDPDHRSAIFVGWNAASDGHRSLVRAFAPTAWWVMGGLLGAVLLGRYLRGRHESAHARVRLEHPERSLHVRPGRTVLEALRAAGIPHASVCGGRARCTTCRIRVGAGAEHLPAPTAIESGALERIQAADNVRLACQLRPRRDLAFAPLLSPDTGARDLARAGGVQGRERRVAILFIDLRASTRLGETRLPFDVVFILNQFFAEMSAALAVTNGHYAQFSGDGLMALYGMESGLAQGSLEAIRGAAEMSRRLARLNHRLAGELEQPLRVGIGIHCGEAIVGTMGPPSSPNLSAVGDNVNVAARLEGQTKVFECTLVVSAETARHAELDLDAFPLREAAVRGRAEPVPVYAVDDPLRLEELLTGGPGA
jgi:adenylate cyclase